MTTAFREFPLVGDEPQITGDETGPQPRPQRPWGINNTLKEVEGELMAWRPKSASKGDFFLYVVLVKRSTDFVTWVYNSQSLGFVNGRYFTNEGQAIENFTTR